MTSQCNTIAETSLKRAIVRGVARRVVLKDAEAYARLYAELQTALSNAWSESMREGITAGLERLRDLGAGECSPKRMQRRSYVSWKALWVKKPCARPCVIL